MVPLTPKTVAARVLLVMLAGMASAHSTAHAQGPYDSRAQPRADIAAASQQARADNKLVLLDFGANWCLDCVVLSRLFDDPGVRPFLREHFHVVQIDVGNWDRNLDVSRQYGDPIHGGIPAVVVLSPSGNVLASTRDGALADARTATAKEILGYLQRWVALRP
jgi:thiol:disulfide interchange protein